MFRVMENRLRKIKNTCRDYYEEIINNNRKGHFKKSSVYDCGNSNCWLCHFDKLAGKRPIKEQPIGDEYEREIKDAESDWQRNRTRDRYNNLRISMDM